MLTKQRGFWPPRMVSEISRGKQELSMRSPWPEMLIAVIVAGSLIYLYRAEIVALVIGSRKQFDDEDALKDVAADWRPTGHIDFSVQRQSIANPEGLAEPHFFHLIIEEHRLINTFGGGAAVERRWRRASLDNAREVTQNYYQFLQEHPEMASNADPRKLMTTMRLLDSPAA
jgi:hypothetical protein